MEQASWYPGCRTLRRERARRILCFSNTVNKIPFGSTGEQVTPLGLGGAPLADVSFESGVATVRRALDLGIRYFDTSPAYGSGLSQAIYGVALEGRDDVFFATKLANFRRPEHHRNETALWAQLGENLRILRRKHVDLLQVHQSDWQVWWSERTPEQQSIGDRDNYDFADSPVLRVLRAAKEEGVCRYVGITSDHAQPLAQILAGVEVDSCLSAFGYDLLHRGAMKHVEPITRERGVALILGAIFRCGLLGEQRDEWLTDPPPYVPAPVRERLPSLYALLQDSGMSLVTLAVRYVLYSPRVSHVLLGAARPEEIEQSVAAFHAGPLPDDLRDAIDKIAIP